MKAFANRERDWNDVRMTILKQKDILDWKYIKKQLEPLVMLKEEPEIMTRLEQLRKRYSAQVQ
jgi:hypothetical protein